MNTNRNNINKKKTYKIYNNFKNHNDEKIKSVQGYDCIGPCYSPNTYYYNPLDLSIISNSYPSCPIKPINLIDSKGQIIKKKSDKCFEEDINKGKLYFDIFSDHIQIATSSFNFLSQLYNLNNISDIVHFLSYTIDTLPIYSQRRLLRAIYDVYYKYIEFPKLLFCKKLLFILTDIYKITGLDENKIKSKLDRINNSNNSNDSNDSNDSNNINSRDLYDIFN